MSLQQIDVKMLSKMFLAGAKNLENKKEWINELNVFPVPDGDTGTNMTMTIMSAAREVSALGETTDMEAVCKAISSGSLRGARGNSGVILSQLFRGFTKRVKTEQTLTISVLAEAFDKAVETAYKAVMKPKEGTILTVARGAADKAKELRGQPGQLKDGHRIPLLANVGKPSDAKTALEYGAEGVGLFRTEFLFIGNEEPPTVEEQTKAYAELLAQFPGKKVVIRLLDAGADKPLPFLTPEDEPNPALGLRGLRTLAQHKAVLEGQLKALAAADAQTDADLWVMAPMVADEWEAEYFTKLGKSFGLKFVGSMAEVPSIAVMADKVSQVTDFVSIGTNDLTQYTLAADRTLGSVSNYQTAWHPAVLRVIKMICEAGNKNGMPVGVCGEAAADPDLAVVLAGLGVNSLSMTPVALDDVRAELAQHTLEEAQQIAAKALNGDFYNPPQWCELGE